MACSVPHTDDEIQALVQKLIDEDMVRQKAILNLALQFDDACTAKDDLRKAYEKCNDIPLESRALIDNFLKEGSDKDYELNLSMYRKAAKIEKQMNANGNRVQVIVRNQDIKKFQPILDEGACYRISNFGLEVLTGTYEALGLSISVLSHQENSLRELCDVIGTTVSISDAIPFNYAGVDKIRRTVILEDFEGARLECCFFYSWSDKFTKLYDERDKSGIVVMILRLAKVKYFNEKPSVNPAMYSTKLYINNDIPEIAAFKKRYIVKMDGLIWHATGVDDPQRKLMMINHHQAVKEQKKKKQKLWYCKVHKALTASGVGMRFKVIVRVIDDTGSASLLLFDDLVFKLSGEQCVHLIRQHGKNYDDYFPDELNVLVGKSQDEATITMFKKDFIIEEPEVDLQTPVPSNANSSRFTNVDNIAFKLDETPKSSYVATKGNASNGDGEYNSMEIESDAGGSG
ncbi:replication protein A 70 kDa DNA-binding subunit B [Tanacetum coccineum]